MNKTVRLVRFLQTPTGTLGRLTIDGTDFECYTMERPWAGNEPCVSCIPTGTYAIKLGRYNRGGYSAYELQEVPRRSLIKMHRGNAALDSLGCILFGMYCAWFHNALFVAKSALAMSGFMQAMDGAQLGVIKITEEWR